jgi:hypothetical protein
VKPFADVFGHLVPDPKLAEATQAELARQITAASTPPAPASSTSVSYSRPSARRWRPSTRPVTMSTMSPRGRRASLQARARSTPLVVLRMRSMTVNRSTMARRQTRD